MSDLKGLFFSNGMQGIGTVRIDGDFFEVTGFLALTIAPNEENGQPATTFQQFSPFLDESPYGADLRVHASNAFLFVIDPLIADAYYKVTSRIQLVSAF